MELKVGMYVRLDRCQGIRKIIEYDERCNWYELDEDICDEWGDICGVIHDNDEDILDANFDIKKLIKEYDYVKLKDYSDFKEVCEFLNDNVVFTGPGFGDWIYLNNDDVIIDAVITKEEIKNIMYEVK